MMSEDECRSVLGVSRDATHGEIIAARRRLARTAHPDSGGDHLEMASINEACRILLAAPVQASNSDAPAQTRRGTGSPMSPPMGHRPSRADHERPRRGFRDAPSFVITTLPVDAFEVLLVAASNLGDIVDEDPPYFLEVLVRDPGPVWCRFELFPDAGATTVILSCDVEEGYRVYSPEEIRDLWIATINE